MKFRIITTLMALVLCSAAFAAKPVQLQSPDGKTVLVYNDFTYSLTVDGKTVLTDSEIGLTLTDELWGKGAKLLKVKKESVSGTIIPINYRKSTISDEYNKLTLTYKGFKVEFRAYNEGVAYRFVSTSKVDKTVKWETADFNFPGDWKSFVPYVNNNIKDIQDQVYTSFENVYQHCRLSELDPAKLAFLPIVVEEPSGLKIAIAESNLFSYPGMFLYNPESGNSLKGYFAKFPDTIQQGGHNNLEGLVRTKKDYIAESPAAAEYPWRIIQVARRDGELAESDMVYKLADPHAEGDWSWVKPGKVAWDWWNDWNISGVPFRAGINNETYKYYIDFAASKGIEYVILDEGWAVNKQADLFQLIPEIDVKELVEYGAERNVGIILWAGYWAVLRDMEHVFSHFSAMGVKGFKIDFMNRDDAPMVDFYTECARLGAKYRMLVDFHGAYKPTGLNRTYPNVINFEGVHGLEQMKWENSDRQVVYDVTIPYIRMMAGPMDYTQGAMRNATKKTYRPINSEPMSLGTRCRQLAEYVVFEAPLTMLCDSPTSYMAEPECTDFIANIPTVWDETRVLDGRIGETIVTARRSGETWYVGAMTDWTARDMEIDLSFLGSGRFALDVFKDGVNADRAAKDYARETLVLENPGKITVHLAPGGGWAAKITK